VSLNEEVYLPNFLLDKMLLAELRKWALSYASKIIANYNDELRPHKKNNL
jgi:hypothetical protein